jgi:hypothetical protein
MIRDKRSIFTCIGQLSAALFTMAVLPHEAHATTYKLTNTSMADVPNAPCTLPGAIKAVNTRKAENGCAAGTGNDVIELLAGVYSATSPLTITAGVTLKGAPPNPAAGPTTFIVSLLTSGTVAAPAALFTVTPPNNAATPVTFQDLYIQNGASSGTVSGIWATSAGASSTLQLTDVWIGPPEGIFYNSAGFGYSAIVADGVDLTVQNSFIFGNSAPYFGGGILYGDELERRTNLVINQSTLADNSSGGYGGALEYAGFGNDSRIANSTVAFNAIDGLVTDPSGGGLDLEGNEGNFSIDSCTIVQNQPDGVLAMGVSVGVLYPMNATIVADNYSVINSRPSPQDVLSDGSLLETNSMIEVFAAGDATIQPSQGSEPNFNGVDPGFPSGDFESIADLPAFGGRGPINNTKATIVPIPVQPLFTASQSGLPNFVSPINKLTSAQIGFKTVAGLGGADTTVDERGFLRPSDTTKSGATYDIGAYEFDPNAEAEELWVVSLAPTTGSTAASLSTLTGNTSFSNGQALELSTKAGQNGTGSDVVLYGVPCNTNTQLSGVYNFIVQYGTGPTGGEVELQISTDPTFTNKSLVLFTSGSTNLYATKAGTTEVTYATNFDYCDDDNVSNAYYFRFLVTGSGVASGGTKENAYDVIVDFVNPVLRVQN